MFPFYQITERNHNLPVSKRLAQTGRGATSQGLIAGQILRRKQQDMRGDFGGVAPRSSHANSIVVKLISFEENAFNRPIDKLTRSYICERLIDQTTK